MVVRDGCNLRLTSAWCDVLPPVKCTSLMADVKILLRQDNGEVYPPIFFPISFLFTLLKAKVSVYDKTEAKSRCGLYEDHIFLYVASV